jgi:excinuclease UvrABC helicase subunit UvrB|tara:strand:+ start:1549 stop:1827 length:279 start_codon:yes stop_codon:yes gene_type:complete
MSEAELNSLANKIADKVFDALLTKQREWDQQFYAEFEDMRERTPSMSKEEVLIIELNDLENLLTNQVKAEQFEKASITKNKITNIKNQIKKL